MGGIPLHDAGVAARGRGERVHGAQQQAEGQHPVPVPPACSVLVSAVLNQYSPGVKERSRAGEEQHQDGVRLRKRNPEETHGQATIGSVIMKSAAEMPTTRTYLQHQFHRHRMRIRYTCHLAVPEGAVQWPCDGTETRYPGFSSRLLA
jgi:hypothetical protein